MESGRQDKSLSSVPPNILMIVVLKMFRTVSFVLLEVSLRAIWPMKSNVDFGLMSEMAPGASPFASTTDRSFMADLARDSNVLNCATAWSCVIIIRMSLVLSVLTHC